MHAYPIRHVEEIPKIIFTLFEDRRSCVNWMIIAVAKGGGH